MSSLSNSNLKELLLETYACAASILLRDTVALPEKYEFTMAILSNPESMDVAIDMLLVKFKSAADEDSVLCAFRTLSASLDNPNPLRVQAAALSCIGSLSKSLSAPAVFDGGAKPLLM